MHKPPLFVCVMLLCGCTVVEAQPNAIRNPGFEEPAKSGGLPSGGWWLYQGQGETEARRDPSVAHTGTASARLHSSAQSKAVLVSAPFPVTPGDEISFEAWVRGEKLPSEPGRTYAGLAFRRADNMVFQHANFPAEAVTGTWTLVSGFAKAPDGAASAEGTSRLLECSRDAVVRRR